MGLDEPMALHHGTNLRASLRLTAPTRCGELRGQPGHCSPIPGGRGPGFQAANAVVRGSPFATMVPWE